MTSEKAQTLFLQFKDSVPANKAAALKDALENAPEENYSLISTVPTVSSTTTLLLSIFLGGFGVDRFYIGDTGLGVCKLLFGWVTLYIWPFVDMFISYSDAKTKNFNKIMAATKAYVKKQN